MLTAILIPNIYCLMLLVLDIFVSTCLDGLDGPAVPTGVLTSSPRLLEDSKHGAWGKAILSG